jgi:hypothetical protein
MLGYRYVSNCLERFRRYCTTGELTIFHSLYRRTRAVPK